MQSLNRMDYLIGHLENLNSLNDRSAHISADISPEEGDAKEEEPPGRAARSKGKSEKTDTSGVSDMFTSAARDVFRRARNLYAGVLGIINPSDGHPQQEHTPDWAWFRPISFNRQSWIDIWPELHI